MTHELPRIASTAGHEGKQPGHSNLGIAELRQCADVQEDATEHVGAVLKRVKHEYLVCNVHVLYSQVKESCHAVMIRVVDDDQTIVRTIRCFAMMTDIESR